jgi:hypothetical protein
MVCAQCATNHRATNHRAPVSGFDHGAQIAGRDAPDPRHTCSRCGALLPPHPAGATGLVVDSTAERGPISAELPPEPLAAAGTAVGAEPDGRSLDLVAARASLPALLWRQPAVRAVARAGAGAIALSVGMRLLRVWLTHPRATRQAAASVLPGVRQLLAQRHGAGGLPGANGDRRVGAGEIEETVIYLRRVVRQR